MLPHFENEAKSRGYKRVAGVDEAGRGPIAGPVVAAACILPDDLLLEGLDDSKALSSEQRRDLFYQITSSPDVDYGIGMIASSLIDDINVLQATFIAMLAAVSKLSSLPDFILVDGPFLPSPKRVLKKALDCLYEKPPFAIIEEEASIQADHHPIFGRAIIEGDRLCRSIAAASILAKYTRDQWMLLAHHKWPYYGFDQHKGYVTAAHRLALIQYGPCPIHRMSFEPLKSLYGEATC